MSYFIYRLHTQLIIFFLPPIPAPMPIFPLIFLFSLFTTHLFHSPVSSHYSPHSSLPLLFSPVILPLAFTCASFISFVFLPPDLPLHILPLTLPPPSPSPPSLRFSGRLLIAVSQYHGGRQRGCRSGGECSTRTAGSYSHVQP